MVRSGSTQHYPTELYRRNGKPVDGIVIHRDELRDDEVSTVRGIPATTPVRTAFDLGRRLGLTTAVIRLDALANATKINTIEVQALMRRHRGMRGLVQLRQVLRLMDGGAESPQETRTRLVLIDAALPSPQTQIVVHDDFGDPFARIDMGYEEWKVGVEYDGAQHWTDPQRRAYDIDRHAELLRHGWRIIRVSADMLRCRPQVIVARVFGDQSEAGKPNLANSVVSRKATTCETPSGRMSSTCSWNGKCRSPSRMYIAAAGCPLAISGVNRISPAACAGHC